MPTDEVNTVNLSSESLAVSSTPNTFWIAKAKSFKNISPASNPF